MSENSFIKTLSDKRPLCPANDRLTDEWALPADTLAASAEIVTAMMYNSMFIELSCEPISWAQPLSSTWTSVHAC